LEEPVLPLQVATAELGLTAVRQVSDLVVAVPSEPVVVEAAVAARDVLTRSSCQMALPVFRLPMDSVTKFFDRTSVAVLLLPAKVALVASLVVAPVKEEVSPVQVRLVPLPEFQVALVARWLPVELGRSKAWCTPAGATTEDQVGMDS
jgi:hypothetical protein